jgi:predicted phosphoadenosine phosphosulfate sulfurtransferase
MLKKPIGVDVYTAAVSRIEQTFADFECVYLSFSAGKDSTVMLHLVADVARRLGRRFGILLIDLEGQYNLTIAHAKKCIDMYSDIADVHWVCLPLQLRNGVSVYEPYWKCWDEEKKDIWIRDRPEWAISDEAFFPFFQNGMEFEEFVPMFGEWYGQGKTTACMVGIRADESLNRFRTIASSKKSMWKGLKWTTKITDNCFNVYPIYDWKTADIWHFHAVFPDKPHNSLYDMMHKAGVPLGNMRICEPYGDDQRRGLWLFHIIEPQTWAKVVARVNGASSGALYVQEWGNINGYRGVTKPSGHTWKSFAELLTLSMPKKTREHFQNKIVLYQRWFGKRGYPDGIPDEAPYELEQAGKAPSWRRVCKTLLRNDYWCKGLGFSQQKSTGYTKYMELMRRRKNKWGVKDAQISFIDSEAA